MWFSPRNCAKYWKPFGTQSVLWRKSLENSFRKTLHANCYNCRSSFVVARQGWQKNKIKILICYLHFYWDELLAEESMLKFLQFLAMRNKPLLTNEGYLKENPLSDLYFFPSNHSLKDPYCIVTHRVTDWLTDCMFTSISTIRYASCMWRQFIKIKNA